MADVEMKIQPREKESHKNSVDEHWADNSCSINHTVDNTDDVLDIKMVM